jgi:hypothetical protein
MKAELDRESQLIDSEKAKAELMARQLDGLGREIERERLSVNRTSQFAVDEFNRKVDNYNRLREKAQEQNRSANEMIDRYNKKLPNYGR